ncbi:MAG: hypothetical protein R3F11_17755 [Verrucomicrobiales bacterium]
MDPTLNAAIFVATDFDELGVRWFVGGSHASSFHGIPRLALGADLVADLRLEHAKTLVGRLAGDWYVDEAAIREAIERRGSFNLIHFEFGQKVDVFVPKRRPFDYGQFARAVKLPASRFLEPTIPICSPEDIVLAKLEWFRLGGEISHQQWADILGVIRICEARFDRGRMRANAAELGVADLLRKAFAEAGAGEE